MSGLQSASVGHLVIAETSGMVSDNQNRKKLIEKTIEILNEYFLEFWQELLHTVLMQFLSIQVRIEYQFKFRKTFLYFQPSKLNILLQLWV